MATVSRTLDAPTGVPAASSDELAALELERGRLSLKPFSLLAVIVFWQALALLNGGLHFYNPKLFPAPADIALAGWALAEKGDLQRHLMASVGRVAIGFVVAAPIAILL